MALIELKGLPISGLSDFGIGKTTSKAIQGGWPWGRARPLAHQSHHSRKRGWRLLLVHHLFVGCSVLALLFRHLFNRLIFPDLKFDVFDLLLLVH